MFGLDAGTLEQKGQLLEAFLEQWGAKQESCCHVATFQCRDVPTSPRRDVPTSRRPTSRRPHVATSPRRDVPTSRRPHVATSQRRDVRSTMQKSTIKNVATSQRRDVATSRRRNVSTGSALHHLKHEWFGNKGASGGVRTRAWNSRAE